MAQNTSRTVTTEGQVISRPGKIVNITVAVSGDRVWALRNGTDDTSPIIYTINAAYTQPHLNLNVPFGALFADVTSGTTGQINIIID